MLNFGLAFVKIQECWAQPNIAELMSETHSNPYAPPTTLDIEVSEPIEHPRLASRWLRLGAAILDNIFVLLASVPVLLSDPFRKLITSEPFRELMLRDDGALGRLAFRQKDMILLGISLVLWIGLIVWNLILLAKRGQTPGKLCCGIKIVRTNYSKASFSRVFWLRGLVNALIASIPVIGKIYGLVDVLFIFGEERKCLHDMFADTIVVYKS